MITTKQTNKAINNLLLKNNYQLSNDVTSLYSMFDKISQGKVKTAKNYVKQMNCHVGLFEENNCDNPIVYERFDKNVNYVNLWYHRYIQKYDQLDSDDYRRQVENDIFSFYTKAIVASSKTQLLHVTFAYNAYKSSEMIAFPAQKFNLKDIPKIQNCPEEGLYNYDPRCREWYQKAISQEGQVYTVPYLFAFDGNIGMTLAQRFDDSTTKEIKSVLGLDYEVQNLIDNIFKPQDKYTNSSLFKGYTVFFHDQNNTIFFHKDWDRKNGVSQSWGDLEFGSNLNPNQKLYQQKIEFNERLQEVKDYCNAHIDNKIEDLDEIDSYIFKFSKEDENFLSIVYPIVVREIQSPFTMQKRSQIVMYIGRIQNDKSNILQSSSWEKRITYLCNFLQPFLILVIIFGCIMHYAAVLVFRIEVPIKLLKTFITQRVKHYESIKKNPNKKTLQSIDCTPCIQSKEQGQNKQQNDKLNLNKQLNEKIAFMNTSMAPLKQRQSSQESGNQFSEKVIKQNNQIEGIRKNTSLLITCDRNSESLNQLEKYCEDEKIYNKQNSTQQITTIPTQLLSSSCSPVQTQSQKQKQQNNNRYLIQLNSNKLLRKSSDSQITRQQQQHIFQHLCLKTYKYQHGQKCEEQDESEVESGLNQFQQNDEQLIKKQQKTDRNDYSIQQNNNAFQNSILDSNHPIHILPNQQTPRLENDRDEEFQELNQQPQIKDQNNKTNQYYKDSEQINIPSTKAQKSEEVITIDKFNSTSTKKILSSYISPRSNDQVTQIQSNQLANTKISVITPSTPKELSNKIELSKKNISNISSTDQIQQKFEEVAIQTEVAQNMNYSNYLPTEVEQYQYPNPEKYQRPSVYTIKQEQKQIKGINFFQRTQNFLKQQLAQITESANQFKNSLTPREEREESNNLKIQFKDIQLLESPNKNNIQSNGVDEYTPALLQQQLEATQLQNEFDVEEFMKQNGIFDTVVHLEDIQTYSHEIEVIVSTFKHLFSVISYMEEGYEKEDFTSSLFSLNRAVTIFKYINNISAVGMAYFDIGNLYFGQERFEEAIERYSISLSCGFQQFEVNSISHFNEVLSTGQLPFDYLALSQFLSRLYFISLSFKELAISFHDDIQLIGRDARSNFLLNQAALYFKTCLRVATFLQKLQKDQFKLLEIVIFIHLFLSEVYIYLNEDFLSECTLKEGTKFFEQLIVKNRQRSQQNTLQNKGQCSPNIQRKSSMSKQINDNCKQNEAQIIEETHTIRTAFYFVRGVIQIKKGLLKDGCISLTNYLEKTHAFQYQLKSLSFLRNVFKKENLSTHSLEKRIEKITPISYDIFILIDVLELAHYSVSHQSLQLKIIKHMKQLFIKPEDKVCVILYNQNFHNNKHWDICFENIKQALKTERTKSSSQHFQSSFDIHTAAFIQNSTTMQSPRPPPLLQDYYSPSSNQYTYYTEWETSVFKSLKEMSLQEIATPMDITQIKRKSILLTFSFSQTSPIHDEKKFTQNFATLFDTFHKQPTVLNFFCSVKQDALQHMTTSQKIIRFQQDSSNSVLLENQFQTQGSFHQQMLNSKNQISRLNKMSFNKTPLLNYNQYRNSFINTPSSQNQQLFRTREMTLDLIDEQQFQSSRQEDQFKRLESLPSSHNTNKLSYDLPKNKIKKFHIFTREQQLFTYLQNKRVEKGNFYLLQRRFFK